MVGDGARFSEATDKKFNKDGIQITSLPDDDIAAMEILMNVMHLQIRNVPDALALPQLDSLAVHCDKYDLAHILGAWPDRWLAPHANDDDDLNELNWGYERFIFIAALMRRPDIFTKVTAGIILHSCLNADGELKFRWDPRDSDFGEGVAATTLGEANNPIGTRNQL